MGVYEQSIFASGKCVGQLYIFPIYLHHYGPDDLTINTVGLIICSLYNQLVCNRRLSPRNPTEFCVMEQLGLDGGIVYDTDALPRGHKTLLQQRA